MFRGCSRTIKTPNSPPLPSFHSVTNPYLPPHLPRYRDTITTLYRPLYRHYTDTIPTTIPPLYRPLYRHYTDTIPTSGHYYLPAVCISTSHCLTAAGFPGSHCSGRRVMYATRSGAFRIRQEEDKPQEGVINSNPRAPSNVETP